MLRGLLRARPRAAQHRLYSAAARTRIAQPTHSSHPHLVAAGEVTPGISAAEYQLRRDRLAAALPRGSAAVFPAVSLGYISHDVPFPYHQNADLFYLCGFQEASSVVACIHPENGPVCWLLFVLPNCAAQAVWDGPRAGIDGAQQHILPEGEVHAISTLSSVLGAALEPRSVSTLFFDRGTRLGLDIERPLRKVIELCEAQRVAVRPPGKLVHGLRLRKSPAEASLHRRSARVSANAFRSTMAFSRDAAARGASEAALAAHFEYNCRIGGAERLAYPCVVASGTHAVTLHYMHNNDVLADGSLVLMDAGGSLHGYCADITRTWPLSGRFTQAQRDIYSAVLDVNERCIAACDAGGQSLNSLHQLSLQLTYDHLVDLGILRRGEAGGASRLAKYYPHALGHWLGLEVHDTPSVETNTKLEPGMVVTVEPGLYFPTDDEQLPRWCRGIGVRIEDDVLMEEGCATVLTSDAPKEPSAVENAVCGIGDDSSVYN